MCRSKFVYMDCYGEAFNHSVSRIHTDIDACREMINESDPARQHAALETLIRQWRAQPEEAFHYCRQVFKSKDERLRAIALGYIGDLFVNSSNATAGAFLSQIARENCSCRERRAAYRALELVAYGSNIPVAQALNQVEQANHEIAVMEELLQESIHDLLPQMDISLLNRFAMPP